jgi:hypothetical protein
LDDLGLSGKLFLPVAIVAAALMMPKGQPITVQIDEWPEIPAPVVTVETPAISFPEVKSPVINVKAGEPVVTEKRVDVPGPERIVYEDREVEVERLVEVRTCLDFDELPYFDLPRAISAARPGESWSLSGDYYPGLVWLDSTPKPTQTEIIAGWLKSLEAQC